jgi:hypothetical protein
MVLVPWYYFHRALFVPIAVKLVSVVRPRKPKEKIKRLTSQQPQHHNADEGERRPDGHCCGELPAHFSSPGRRSVQILCLGQPGRAPPSDQDPSARHRPQAFGAIAFGPHVRARDRSRTRCKADLARASASAHLTAGSGQPTGAGIFAAAMSGRAT